MGVYYNKHLIGVNKWCCTKKLDKISFYKAFPTEKEAWAAYRKAEQEIAEGVFKENHKKEPKRIKVFSCNIIEGDEGDRCNGVLSCNDYSECLKLLFKHNLKGWRIDDTAIQGNAQG